MGFAGCTQAHTNVLKTAKFGTFFVVFTFLFFN